MSNHQGIKEILTVLYPELKLLARGIHKKSKANYIASFGWKDQFGVYHIGLPDMWTLSLTGKTVLELATKDFESEDRTWALQAYMLTHQYQAEIITMLVGIQWSSYHKDGLTDILGYSTRDLLHKEGIKLPLIDREDASYLPIAALISRVEGLLGFNKLNTLTVAERPDPLKSLQGSLESEP